MKRLKEKLWAAASKKERGTVVEALLTFCVFFVALLALFLIAITTFSQVNARWQAKQVARDYILVAETQGYLTPDDINKMRADLKAIGVTNVDFTGTSQSEVPYGSKVYVKFNGVVKDHVFNFGASHPGNRSGSGLATQDKRIYVQRVSISKQQE